MADAERLKEIFEQPGLRWLMDRLVERVRRGRPLRGSVGRRRPSAEERRAVERLLGRPTGRGGFTLRLEDLEERLRHAELAENLADVVQAVVGLVENRRAQRDAHRQRIRALLVDASKQDPRPALARWLASRRNWVLLRRWGKEEGAAERLVQRALAVLARLPADRILLQELALDVTGDAHALDPGHRLATLVIAAVAEMAGEGGDEDSGRELDWHDAAGWRDLWSRVGVATDDLSAPVLVFGLRGLGRSGDDSPFGRLLDLHYEMGDPCRLSLRQLVRHEKDLHHLLAARPVDVAFVCENPAVVLAAAERVRHPAAPLICLEGQPATAARRLLDNLAESGTRLRYHGDFDWPGLRIANLVMKRHGAEPWRYDAAIYERLNDAHAAGPELVGPKVEASWDVRLGSAMAKRGRAVHEEAMLDELLEDLEPQYVGLCGGAR